MLFQIILHLLALVALARGATTSSCSSKRGPQQTEKKVFAHFMLGFVGGYDQAEFVSDIKLAHSKGIDGFALNCDSSSFIPKTLKLAYAAAEEFNAGLTRDETPFHLFVSVDFLHFSVDNPGAVADLVRPVINSPAQYVYDNKAFISSFEGRGIDWKAVGSALGKALYSVPYYSSREKNAADSTVDGLFSWNVWPGQVGGPVKKNMTTGGDLEYLSALEPLGKTYMAPVSPWFYAHLPASTGWPKNYLLYCDTLFTTRWSQLLQLGVEHSALKFIEIITWNDWSEASQISPYKGSNSGDGISKWAADFPHESMLELQQPYIVAFKAGKKEPEVTKDMLVYWYRPTLKKAMCDSTDTVGTKPAGWNLVDDSIFVAAMTTSAATVTVKSGNKQSTQYISSAGIHTLAFPMNTGTVSFDITMADGRVGSAKGAIEISSGCYNGVYNFNILTGIVSPDA